MDRLYSQLQSANPNACILSVVPGYSGAFVPTIRLSTLPPLMSSYFSAEKMDLPFSDLIEQCDTVFNSLSVTCEQAQNLEMKTREQSKFKLWNKYIELEELQLPFSSKYQCQIHLTHPSH